MGFFTVDTSEENVRDYSGEGSAYINKSGIYDVVIKAVIVDKTQNGSEFLNLWIEHQGQEQPIFQAMRLTNNDGSPNLGAKLFTKLCVILGADNGQILITKITQPILNLKHTDTGTAIGICMQTKRNHS